MNSTKQQTKYRSRLAKIESRRFQQQTFVIIAVTLLIIVLIIIFGIPIMIRLAIFFGDLRSGTSFTDNGDKIPPYTPQIVSLPIATNSARLDISGFSEAGSTVTLLRGNKRVDEVIADADSQFAFEDIELQEGDNSYTLLASDEEGNESRESDPQIVVFDVEPPELTNLSPEEGKEFFGREESLVTITGETEVGARVTINDKNVVVGSDGKFDTTFQLQEGDNQFLVKVKDKAGNLTEETRVLKFRP